MKLANGRVELALHDVRAFDGDADAPALLLLHAIGGSSRDWVAHADRWPGPVRALDFSGHGESHWIAGGGYTPESFVADADIALDALAGDVYVAGAGVGAYVAFLLAGARASRIPAALLLPGAGYDGGGAEPDYEAELSRVPDLSPTVRSACAYDPLVASCENDLRPIDYAEEFARAARLLLVGARSDTAPPWLETARQTGRVESAPADPGLALQALARAATAQAQDRAMTRAATLPR